MKEVQSHLQPCTSMPEGLAAPWVCRAARRMVVAVIWSNMTGCTSGGSAFPSGSAAGETGWAWDWTFKDVQGRLLHLVPKINSENTSLTLLRDNCMAAHICPGTSAWRIGKRIYSLPFLEGLNLGKPDCRNDLHQGGLQCHHSSRWVIFSPGKPSGPCLEGRKGFCKRRIGKTEPAFSAIASIADPPAYARNNLLNSATKPLPAFPRGKLFFYQ